MPTEQPRPNLLRDLWMADRAKNHISMIAGLPWWKRVWLAVTL